MADDVDVDVRGPLFDGRALIALDDMVEDLADTVADAGVVAVRVELARVLREPTGYYASQIRTEQVGGDPDEVRVGDDVVYGAWLAGVGSRNSPASSFPGYDHWTRAREDVEQALPTVVEPVVTRHVRRMG